MKKNLFFLIVSLFFISCGTDYYVLNSHSKPRPSSQFKFKLDKKNSETNIGSVIDTNAIYISSAFRRMKPEVSDLYYRFMPDGVVYEVVLSGDPVESTVKDTAIGNYGKYKLKKNKIKMEFMLITMGPYYTKKSHSPKVVVERRFRKAVIRDGNLFLVPRYYSEVKGFYREVGKFSLNGYAGLLAVVVVPPVFLVDAAIPDEKVCFRRVGLNEVENYKKKDTISK